MRLRLVPWILGALMCGASVAGYVGKPQSKVPQKDARWYAANYAFDCVPCRGAPEQSCPRTPEDTSRWDPPDWYLGVGDLVCKYPSEAIFLEARATALARSRPYELAYLERKFERDYWVLKARWHPNQRPWRERLWSEARRLGL